MRREGRSFAPRPLALIGVAMLVIACAQPDPRPATSATGTLATALPRGAVPGSASPPPVVAWTGAFLRALPSDLPFESAPRRVIIRSSTGSEIEATAAGTQWLDIHGWSPDGSRALVSDTTGTPWIVAEDGQARALSGTTGTWFVWSGPNEITAVTGGTSPELVRIDPRSGARVGSVAAPEEVRSGRTSADGRWLAYETGGQGAQTSVRVIEIPSGQRRLVASDARLVGWTSSAHVIVQSGTTLRAIDSQTGKAQDIFSGASDALSSAKSDVIIALDEGRTPWRVAIGLPSARLPGRVEGVLWSLSSDGRYLSTFERLERAPPGRSVTRAAVRDVSSGYSILVCERDCGRLVLR